MKSLTQPYFRMIGLLALGLIMSLALTGFQTPTPTVDDTAAGLNILAFELSPRAKAMVNDVGPGDNTPLRLKFAGGISLFSWFAVLYFGRMLPFIGNAF